jgi:predicted ABC-class ATPase
MARLLRPGQEPIVPLVARLREIFERFGASTILVAGGSGEAFRVADRVVVMDRYCPLDATQQVAAIRLDMGPDIAVPLAAWPSAPRRAPIGGLRERRPRVRALGASKILLGGSTIDLGASGALVHPSQARTLAGLLAQWIEKGEENATVPDTVGECGARLAAEGPATAWSFPRGDLAEVRPQEIAMLLSRLRAAGQADAEAEEGTPGGL